MDIWIASHSLPSESTVLGAFSSKDKGVAACEHHAEAEFTDDFFWQEPDPDYWVWDFGNELYCVVKTTLDVYQEI